jgi:hypothetical protein
MKAQDARRASILVSALNELKLFAENSSQPDKDWMVRMAIGQPYANNNLGVPDYKASVFVDCATGKLIGEAAEKIIREQLTAMGVEL